MKKLVSLVFIIATIACNSNKQKKQAAVDSVVTDNANSIMQDSTTTTVIKDSAIHNKIVMPGQQCFQSILQRDTITIKLNIKDNIVFGDLEYNMFEKDDNKGRFKGKLINNSFKADYIFRSEGKISTREVIFQLKDNTLIEGFGEMEEKHGKIVFKNPEQVNFTQVYKPIDCK